MLNALDASNYFQFNISAAQYLGLNNAIYCSELINILQKATKKKKLVDGYIVLNRNYIAHRTTLDVETQYVCDASLKKVGIVTISKENPDKIKLNYERFVEIITGEDSNYLKEIGKKIRTSSQSDAKT